jgi:hypothetical protein
MGVYFMTMFCNLPGTLGNDLGLNKNALISVFNTILAKRV